MCSSYSGCAAAFFSANGAALSQEAADSKINVQLACTLNMVYMLYAILAYDLITSFITYVVCLPLISLCAVITEFFSLWSVFCNSLGKDISS
jgi:hypothetical protein